MSCWFSFNNCWFPFNNISKFRVCWQISRHFFVHVSSARDGKKSIPVPTLLAFVIFFARKDSGDACRIKSGTRSNFLVFTSTGSSDLRISFCSLISDSKSPKQPITAKHKKPSAWSHYPWPPDSVTSSLCSPCKEYLIPFVSYAIPIIFYQSSTQNAPFWDNNIPLRKDAQRHLSFWNTFWTVPSRTHFLPMGFSLLKVPQWSLTKFPSDPAKNRAAGGFVASGPLLPRACREGSVAEM